MAEAFYLLPLGILETWVESDNGMELGKGEGESTISPTFSINK